MRRGRRELSAHRKREDDDDTQGPNVGGGAGAGAGGARTGAGTGGKRSSGSGMEPSAWRRVTTSDPRPRCATYGVDYAAQRQLALIEEEERREERRKLAEDQAVRMARICATRPPEGLPDLLPEEVWIRVFEHLPVVSWKPVGRVCRMFYRIARDQLANPVVQYKRKREQARLRSTTHGEGKKQP